ncbi:ECF RNA polymerase sigma factor SigJ [Streptomyces sp. YIM 130001]|uniref:RNA polymerase sigma factor SigJ n=1 Tax=Streptomyces sp. YIM 130001 TaxID=2259644 RepID=UPI000E658923|nr:RNA polymerase sigma factor SigJ [Streptomyces sp. YIM 130001]RII20322.1 ECF RNA polymerase sigma factor SigJ [Streptomyces sp. YIM 130001]
MPDTYRAEQTEHEAERDADALAARFEQDRPRLRSVAYRMLGSLSEAEDAVQEAWIRLARTGDGALRDVSAWLTTVVSRVCLDMLRSRTARREEPLDTHVPDPVVTAATAPEEEAVLTDSVGLALLVVLDRLAPAERIAFVLHDLFAVPFDSIAPVVDRTPAATRQLASRARRRVRREGPAPQSDTTRRRQVVEAFLAASRAGDLDALVAVLDPEVVLRVDAGALEGGVSHLVRGAGKVAGQAVRFRRVAPFARLALVNGAPGLVTAPNGEPVSVMDFTIRDGLVVEINLIADRARLRDLGLPDLGVEQDG